MWTVQGTGEADTAGFRGTLASFGPVSPFQVGKLRPGKGFFSLGYQSLLQGDGCKGTVSPWVELTAGFPDTTPPSQSSHRCLYTCHIPLEHPGGCLSRIARTRRVRGLREAWIHLPPPTIPTPDSKFSQQGQDDWCSFCICQVTSYRALSFALSFGPPGLKQSLLV